MDFLIAKVTDHNIPRSKWLELREAVKSYEGKEVIITIERKTKKRSIAQNKYLWAVVVKMICLRLRELGFEMSNRLIDEQDTYLLLTTKFLKRDMVNQSTGEILTTYLGTSSLTTSEMMDFIENCQKWASETLNLYIPDPINI